MVPATSSGDPDDDLGLGAGLRGLSWNGWLRYAGVAAVVLLIAGRAPDRAAPRSVMGGRGKPAVSCQHGSVVPWQGI
jgi:hypothetical protein